MANPIEEGKGRLKEAVGAVTGSASIKREGRAQQDKAEAQEEAARHQERAETAASEASKARSAESRHQ